MALVGMKSDLPRREVQATEVIKILLWVCNVQADAFAKSIGCKYFETSAKDGTNVDEMFLGVVQTLFEK